MSNKSRVIARFISIESCGGSVTCRRIKVHFCQIEAAKYGSTHEDDDKLKFYLPLRRPGI